MAFLHHDPGKLLAVQTEDSDEGREKLSAFRQKVQNSKHVKYWESPEDLAGKVALTWNTFRRRYPATGWIKADQVTSKESLEALAKAQAEIDELKAQLETVRTQAPPGTEGMAQGKEKFTLPVYVHGVWRALYNSKIGTWAEIEMTWDRIFGYLGLRMMQEADEPTIKSDLCIVAASDNWEYVKSVFKTLVKETAEGEGIERYTIKTGGVDVSDEDFQTILLQLNALGLIQHSSRPRSVKDTANYWTLTPYGNTYLVQLRALTTNETTLERLEPLEQSVDHD